MHWSNVVVCGVSVSVKGWHRMGWIGQRAHEWEKLNKHTAPDPCSMWLHACMRPTRRTHGAAELVGRELVLVEHHERRGLGRLRGGRALGGELHVRLVHLSCDACMQVVG